MQGGDALKRAMDKTIEKHTQVFRNVRVTS